jgi:molybdenum cofactor cytidylyltransferase
MAPAASLSIWQRFLSLIGMNEPNQPANPSNLVDKALSSPTSIGAQPVTGILLAAGRGLRFDASGERSKLMHPLDGVPVACHAASQLGQACDQVLAVVRPGQPELQHWLKQFGCTVVQCPDAHSGMGHSLAWGVAEAVRLFDPRAAVLMLGDMPFVSPATITQLIAHSAHPKAIIAPVYQGRRGHPVLFGQHWFEALGRCSGDKGAEHVLKNSRNLTLLEVQDPGVLRDIDTPEDLHPPANLDP